METFVLVIFWLNVSLVAARIFNIVSGVYANKVSISTYSADTVIAGIIAIWAGFALWY